MKTYAFAHKIPGYAFAHKSLKTFLWITSVLFALTSSAFAHSAGCDGKPVPHNIKAQCCGISDAHQINPSRISQDGDGNWLIQIGSIIKTIPALNSLKDPNPQIMDSPDGCYWLFWPAGLPDEAVDQNTPIYCWLIPANL